MIYKFADEVPRAWRRLDGHHLNLSQANKIIGDAQKAADGGTEFPQALWNAREAFRKNNSIRDGWWVGKGSKK